MSGEEDRERGGNPLSSAIADRMSFFHHLVKKRHSVCNIISNLIDQVYDHMIGLIRAEKCPQKR
jgi:hypothetical protein